jgi:hypothetical protein
MANGHGGRRAGAGRKPGATTRRTREIAERAIAEGVPPLEYMLAVMRDEQADLHRRDEMAKAAAPYIHPRLATIEQRPAQERAPTIAERVTEYDREDAIGASDGKVVALRSGQ